MSRGLVNGLFLAHIPNSNLLVSRGRDEHATARIPRQALDDVGVLKGEGRLAGGDVPELDGEVSGGGSKDILSGGVEEDLPDFPAKDVLVY